MLSLTRRLKRFTLINQFKYYTTEKKVAGSDYFKSIVHNANPNAKSLKDLEIDESHPDNAQFNNDSAAFAKKVIENPNRYIENRRSSFIQKSTENYTSKFNSKRDKTLDEEIESFNESEPSVTSQPRDWSQEIQHIKEEKRTKRAFFKKQNRTEQIEPNLQLDLKFSRKFSNKLQMTERRESFKDKFIEFKKNKETKDLEPLSEDKNDELTTELDQEKDMMPIRPVVYNLAYFVNDNIVLKKFIEMGVMIRKWDKDRAICEFILKLDIERDIKPHLIFLHDIGIPAEKHAKVIENNAAFFKETLDDLQIRIDYLKSKKFTDESIVEIVCKAPRWLSLSVEQVDTKLGWFQNEFNLTGSELRDIVTSRPKLITLPLKIASDVKFCLKDFLSFSDNTIKRLIKTYPKLFTKDFKIIEANYNYLTKVIKLTDQQIETYPPILQTPLLLVRTRYSFLRQLNRVQFDPTLPNYISIKNMIEHDEAKFLEKYAKSTLEDYKKFLKTI